MAFARLLRSTQRYLERVREPIPTFEQRLFDFSTPASLARWATFSDTELGGRSTASLIASTSHPGTAVFQGTFSRETGADADERLKRSGFVGMNTRDTQDRLDLDQYDTMVLRVLGDGRRYIASIRTENWIIGEASSHDVYQAFLFAREGEWTEVEIPLARFLLTYKGRLVETHVQMNRSRIVSFGLALAGGDYQQEGPYSLGLDWIKVIDSRRLDR
ncbi:NUOFAF1 [Auxenochlorella protothecoides x Auxenochlorella symbiontica]